MVDPRLDCDDAVDLQDVVALRAHPRLLVHLHAEAVAEAVREELAQPCLRDQLTGDGVDVAALPARPGRPEPGQLRLQADVVRAREVVRQLARRECPRAVRVVAVDLRGGVDDHRLPRLDRDVARARVRQRPVRPAGDDRRERHVLGAEVAHRPLDPPGELLLRAARESLLGQAGEGLVRDRRRPADRVQLARLLDRAHRLQQPVSSAPSRRRRRRSPPTTRTAGAPTRTRRASAGAPAAARRDCAGSRPPRARSPSPSRVAEVGEDPHAVGLDEHGRIRAVEAGQPEDVDRLRDEQRLAGGRPHALDALAHAFVATMNSSASR